MKLCRFEDPSGRVCAGLVAEEGSLLDLSSEIGTLTSLLEAADLKSRLAGLAQRAFPRRALRDVRLLAPIEQQEVWAAGVTYLRSKEARVEESAFGASAYGRVYDAARPELFFKSLPGKVVGPEEPVGIRHDAKWSVPEPELALVINSRGQLAGFTVGNDMSSRDLEGENPLYLPQAKIYHRSCALGPFITVGATEQEARAWTIRLTISRAGKPAFQGEVSVGQIKRTFGELVECLFCSQTFGHGAILLTGTGVVPPNDFTLQPQDRVSISISNIGTLENVVVQV